MSASARTAIRETSSTGSATDRLARFVTSATVGDEVRRQAARAVADTLAVTIAGGAEPAVRTLAASFETQSGRDTVKALWDATSYRTDDAALLLGMASHVLDYDDVSMLTVCHPSAPVLSALLALVPERTSGAAFLDAFAIGTEALIRLGQAMGFRHYALGFHATATLGTIGAAATAARVLKLDERSTAHAIAIAASLSSGLRKNFGSMVKSLHVGISARNGILAARLARAGIEGASEPLDGEGFLQAFSGGEVDVWPTDLVLGHSFALAEPGFEQKRYPCCYMLHKIIEATLGMARESGLRLDDIVSMRVDMPAGGTKPLSHPYPRNGLNALFSAPYAVAASIADGKIDLKSFTDEAVLRPEIQARLQDVIVVEAEGVSRHGSDVGSAPVTVTLTPRAGGSLSRTIVASPGSPQDPLTPLQLEAKWIDCLQRTQPSLDATRAAGLLRSTLALTHVADMRDWMDELRGSLTIA